MSWEMRLNDAREKLRARKIARADPWCLPLERLRGKVGDDGIERVTTQTVFDILEVQQRSRGAGACRRLAAVMAKLGWTAVRVRGLTRGGYREQVRGYARDARNKTVPSYHVANQRPSLVDLDLGTPKHADERHHEGVTVEQRGAHHE